jgi:hypothetical protein
MARRYYVGVVAMTVLFSAGTLYSLYRLFRGTPALVLNEQGMVDDTNNFSWEPIRNLH